MKKTYQKPYSKSIRVTFEHTIALSMSDSTISDSNKGDFEGVRRRMWDEEEEEQ